jgi:hypothetical protein
MRITDTKLKEIIEEELTDALMAKGSFGGKKQSNTGKKWTRVKKSNDEESDTERKRRIFGHEELDKLARGITENPEDMNPDCPEFVLCDTETKECEPTHFLRPRDEDDEEDLDEMNDSHSSDGRFSSKSDETCKSSYFVDKERKSKGGSLSDKDDTGRGKNKNKGKGRFRCKDNEPLWESKYRIFRESAEIEETEEEYDSPHDESVEAPRDTYECAKKLQDQKVLMRKLKNAVKKAKDSGSKTCPLSYGDAVKIINQLEKASKGKAFETED